MLRRAQPLLGTLVELAVEAPEPSQALRASEAAFAAVRHIHDLMSFQTPGSELHRLNQAAVGEWVGLTPDTVSVLVFALDLSARTDGLFDVCASGARRGLPGRWTDLVLDEEGGCLCKRRPMELDLSGVAKGHAVDMAVAALRAAGGHSGWVNAGGDLRVFGAARLALAVRAPWDLGQSLSCTRLHERAAATSACYTPGEATLCHGVSGQPLRTRASWTVAAPDARSADALTKLVALTGDACHPLLARYRAEAWVYDAAPTTVAA